MSHQTLSNFANEGHQALHPCSFYSFFSCQTDELNVHFRLPAPICNSIFHFGSKSSGPTKLSTTVSLFICKLPLTAGVNGFHHINSNQTLSFRTRGKRYPGLGINRFGMTARHLYWQSFPPSAIKVKLHKVKCTSSPRAPTDRWESTNRKSSVNYSFLSATFESHFWATPQRPRLLCGGASGIE